MIAVRHCCRYARRMQQQSQDDQAPLTTIELSAADQNVGGAKEVGLAEGAKITALDLQRVEQERLTAVAAQREAAEKAAAREAAQLEAQRIGERVNAAKANLDMDAVVEADPDALKKYQNVDALLDPVRRGSLAPLSGRYLVELAEGKGCLKRRQDLPERAFQVCTETSLGNMDEDDQRHAFIALSYRWLEKDHPDPAAFHLTIVAHMIKVHLEKWRGRVLDVAVFWDFGSLHQKDRVGDQDVLFKEGLRASNLWYGSTQSVVWLQPHLPPRFDKATYDASGWCFVEASISSVIKDFDQRWNLGKLEIDDVGNVVTEGTYDNMRKLCQRDRLPPLRPSKVQSLLANDKKFTNNADVDTVANIYASFFNAACACERLLFHSVGWSAAHVADFAETLPFFTHLTALGMSDNKLGDEGATILAKALEANSTIKKLYLTRNRIGDDGAVALAHSVKANSTIEELYLVGNRIGDDGTVALAHSVKANDTITTLSLSSNKIGDAGATALAESLKESATLKILYFRDNCITDKGRAALQEAQQVSNAKRGSGAAQLVIVF